MEVIFPIVAVAGALVLAMGALRSHHLSFEKKAWMAVAWVLIIAGLAFALGQFDA